MTVHYHNPYQLNLTHWALLVKVQLQTLYLIDFAHPGSFGLWICCIIFLVYFLFWKWGFNTLRPLTTTWCTCTRAVIVEFPFMGKFYNIVEVQLIGMKVACRSCNVTGQKTGRTGTVNWTQKTSFRLSCVFFFRRSSNQPDPVPLKLTVRGTRPPGALGKHNVGCVCRSAAIFLQAETDGSVCPQYIQSQTMS